MRLGLIVSLLLLLASCGGGHAAPRGGQQDQLPGSGATGGQPTPNPDAGSVRVTLTADQDGSDWRVNLIAPSASDLYQIGGTIAFDSSKYAVVAVEAGGGLGQPDNSYFVGKETSPGRVAFAYTKRFYGAGANGKLWLVSLRVHPKGSFSAADFKLDPEQKLMARDSKKRVMRIDAGGAQ
jgi:hypothetical protein